MPQKRIIAHFMHETERERARPLLNVEQETEGYLVGTVDEAQIPTLSRAGIVVQSMEQPQSPVPEIADSSVFDVLALKSVGPTSRIDQKQPGFYVLSIAAPLVEVFRENLDKAGAKLLERLGPGQYTTYLTPPQAAAVSKLGFATLTPYGRDETPVTTQGEPYRPPASDRGQRMQTFDVRLHRPEDLDGVRRWCKDNHVDIAGAKGRKLRIYVLENAATINAIAALPAVASVDEYIVPELHNDVARVILGIDGSNPHPGKVINETGAGEIVGVADTGLDDAHPDFQGRIVGQIARGRPNDTSDPAGHGTHVCGSILGDGSASGGAIRGTAPGARLFLQSLLDASGRLGGLPLDLNDLFDEAYQAGARIHNNSWGTATKSHYTVNSIEVDEFVANHRDMLIVVSAGNDGTAANPKNTPRGIVDLLSIGAPASSKNALTVGACRSSRTNGAYSTITWGQGWPQNFPDNPIAGENVSGDNQAMAAFSSRGPCNDRRIKPDVVAPGTDVLSTRSAAAPSQEFWGLHPANPRYAYMGGTSMAAPLATGCAALVREYYRTTRQQVPSAALLKATLINGTKELTAADSLAGNAFIPNHHQGFGAIFMPWTIPNAQEAFTLEFIDSWQSPNLQFVRTGQRFRFSFSCQGGARLRVCLAWTDLPGRALQNDLNLFLEWNQQTKWTGNEHAPFGLDMLDPDNNVELVRLDNPQPGPYLIQITASNLLKTPQDFALVVTGDLAGPLQLV